PASDTWTGISGSGAPEARIQHTAVWATKNGQSPVMVVWGGLRAVNGLTNTGARYNPATDTWQATTTVNAPIARAQHSAVWANPLGSQTMIVWGGIVPGLTNSGGRYDPFTDVWSDVTTTGAPAVRSQHQAVWSGTEMLVWGGANGNQQPVAGGGRY